MCNPNHISDTHTRDLSLPMSYLESNKWYTRACWTNGKTQSQRVGILLLLLYQLDEFTKN